MKRRIVSAWKTEPAYWEILNFAVCAPTNAQAMRLYWDDFKLLIGNFPCKANKSDQCFTNLVTGHKLWVVGMDKAARIEGLGLLDVILDEYANMKADVWDAHISPMLDRPSLPRPGRVAFIGVPEGKNHYWHLWKRAESSAKKWRNWEGFRWGSEGIIDDEILAEKKATMDPRLYRQEHEGSFEDFAGRVYADFDARLHASEPLKYDPMETLVLTFDFNVDPGTASILQETLYTGTKVQVCKDEPIIKLIGEVHIPQDSRTKKVCAVIAQNWQKHQGPVDVYYDPSGGSRHTSQGQDGTDIDVIETFLGPVFGNRLTMVGPRKEPGQRQRINALNARILAADHKARLLVDPDRCPHIIEDFEGVRILEGTAGEIDKKSDPHLSHLSDGIAYFAAEKYPAGGRKMEIFTESW